MVVLQEKNEADDPTVLMAIGRKKEIHVLVKEKERGIVKLRDRKTIKHSNSVKFIQPLL